MVFKYYRLSGMIFQVSVVQKRPVTTVGADTDRCLGYIYTGRTRPDWILFTRDRSGTGPGTDQNRSRIGPAEK